MASRKSTTKSSKGKKAGKAKTAGAQKKRSRCAKAKKRAPVILAAIDVGATAVRMEIAQADPDSDANTVEPLEQLVHPIAIGTDTFQLKRITPPTMRALCEVLRNFRRVLDEYQVETCSVVATSAIREATNQDHLLDRIAHETGFRVEVLDASEESRLTYMILLPFLRENGLAEKDTTSLVLDLGGGSTEIMALEGTRVRLAGARRLGTARLFYSVGAADCQNERALLTSIIHNVVNSAHDLYRGLPIRELLVINSVLARALLHEPGAEAAPHGLRVPVEAVRTAAADAGEQCGEALAARFGVSQSDAELLQPALLTLESFLDTVPVSRIFLPEVDLISGLFLDQLLRLRGQDPFDVFREQIKSAAMSLARKYHSEGGHSLQVTNLCRQLFDGLSDYLDLTERDRIYLEIGAILHDVGRFINDNDHHKHGHYIVIHSDLMGFSEEERNLIALLVRYHRKGRPRETHPEYASLTRRDRLRVAKLASLLRLADALDREHEERVRTLHVSIGEETLDIAAEASGDLAVEKDAIRRKGTLFVDLTGLRINLRRHMG